MVCSFGSSQHFRKGNETVMSNNWTVVMLLFPLRKHLALEKQSLDYCFFHWKKVREAVHPIFLLKFNEEFERTFQKALYILFTISTIIGLALGKNREGTLECVQQLGFQSGAELFYKQSISESPNFKIQCCFYFSTQGGNPTSSDTVQGNSTHAFWLIGFFSLILFQGARSSRCKGAQNQVEEGTSI